MRIICEKDVGLQHFNETNTSTSFRRKQLSGARKAQIPLVGHVTTQASWHGVSSES